MKRIIFFVNFIVAIIASKTNDDKNINVALETVLEFDGKQVDADKQFLNSMQGFLQKIKTAIGTYQSKAKSKGGIQVHDFMKHLFSALGGLTKKEMDVISKTIKTEIERRYENDDDFRELIQIPVVRRSLNSGIEILKNAPQNVWINFARRLQYSSESSDNNKYQSPNMRSTFVNWSKNIISWVSNLFPTREQINMNKDAYKVIDDLKDYTKLKINHYKENTQRHDDSENEEQAKYKKEKEIDEALRNPEKLVKIVKNALRTLLFDQYTNLDDKKRKLIQQRLQSFWMDPNSNPDIENKVSKKNKKRSGRSTTERSGKIRTTKRNSKGKKKRFEIKYTTRQTKTPKHAWSGSGEDDGNSYKTALRMKPETKSSQTSLSETDEDAIKRTEEDANKRTEEKTKAPSSTKTTPSEISKSNENKEKSFEWSSERNDGSAESYTRKTTTLRTFKPTATTPRTEKPPKKTTTKKIKKHETKHSAESEDSGYLSESKNIKNNREPRRKTTTEKTTTTTRTTTTRRTTSRTTTEQTSLELQSAEKSTTTEKSLMDSLREIITDDQKPFNQEPSKETKEFSFESSKEKPIIARQNKLKKKQSKEEKQSISKNRSNFETKSDEENRSDTEKESKEKHKNSKNVKPIENKESEEKKLDTLESWSEVESKEKRKNDVKINTKEQVRDITKENKSENKMDVENKSDFHRNQKTDQVNKPKSDEEYDPKFALRMSNPKKQKSKSVKEKPTKATTQTTKVVSRAMAMLPHVRVIEENIGSINVVKEDEVFTDHSEEKKRAKQIRNNLREKKNEEHKDHKPETKSQKWARMNRAASKESTQKNINATLSANTVKTNDNHNFYHNNVQKVNNNQRALNQQTTDTFIINSKLAPYNKKVLKSIGDMVIKNDQTQTTQTAEVESTANVAGEKAALSAESEALFRALEEQERKHGIDNLLDNSDLIDLQNLNISFITTMSEGRSKVTLSPNDY